MRLPSDAAMSRVGASLIVGCNFMAGLMLGILVGALFCMGEWILVGYAVMGPVMLLIAGRVRRTMHR